MIERLEYMVSLRHQCCHLKRVFPESVAFRSRMTKTVGCHTLGLPEEHCTATRHSLCFVPRRYNEKHVKYNRSTDIGDVILRRAFVRSVFARFVFSIAMIGFIPNSAVGNYTVCATVADWNSINY